MLGFPRHRFSQRNIVDALKEFISVLCFGLMPITLGLLLSWLSPSGNISQFFDAFLSSGEALLISSALVGPFIYVLFKNYGDLPKLSNFLKGHEDVSRNITIQFPFGWFFVCVIFLICVIAAAVFGYNSALPDKDKLLPENLTILSGIILVVSLMIFFALSLIRNNMEEGPASIMTSGTESFLDKWDRG